MAASSFAQRPWRHVVWASSLAIISGGIAFAGEGNGSRSGEPHRLQIGDTIGVYVEGVLGDRKTAIPVAVPREKSAPARAGYPLRVREDGSVAVPRIAAVKVEGKTIVETQALIDGAFERFYEQRSDVAGEPPETAVTLMRKRPADEPKIYRVRPGDVLGLFVGGIVGDMNGQPPVHLEYRPKVLPSMGYPIAVEPDGSIQLPFVRPIDVANKTLLEVESEIYDAYLVDQQILNTDGLHRIVVAPMWIEGEADTTDSPRLQAGDTVALLFLEYGTPMLPAANENLDHDFIFISEDGARRPFWGFPFPVLQDGTIDLPLIPPVEVQGKTISEARRLISDVYHTETRSSPPPIMLSLIREHQKIRRRIPPEQEIESGDLLCIAGLPSERDVPPAYFFPDNSELAPCFGQLIPVLLDGTVLLPTIGRLQAAGRSTNELEDDIRARYVEQRVFVEHFDYVIVRIARRAG